MLLETKLKTLDELRTNIKRKKIILDETKENFGFDRMKQLRDVDKDYVQGIPYRLTMKDGKKFVLKVTPIEKIYEKDKNPAYIENIILKEMTNTCIKKYNIPNFSYYLGSDKINCKAPALRTKYFSLLNNEGTIRSKCNVILSEYVERGSLYDYVKDRDLSLDVWKSLIFQVVYAIYAMQKEFKLMHNDLHHGNILIDKVDDSGYITYNVNGVKNYIKHDGLIAKLFDFEFSMAYKKIDGMYDNVLIENHKEYFDYYNEGVDVHSFLESLLDFDIPQDLERWIRSKYDERILLPPQESSDMDVSSKETNSTNVSYRSNMFKKSKSSKNTNFSASDSTQVSISKGNLVNQRKLLKGAENIVKLVSPLEILNDEFFSSYKTKPHKYDLYSAFNFECKFN